MHFNVHESPYHLVTLCGEIILVPWYQNSFHHTLCWGSYILFWTLNNFSPLWVWNIHTKKEKEKRGKTGKFFFCLLIFQNIWWFLAHWLIVCTCTSPRLWVFYGVNLIRFQDCGVKWYLVIVEGCWKSYAATWVWPGKNGRVISYANTKT